MNSFNVDDVKNTIPEEMLNEMKSQAEKYGMDFDEYLKQCMGAAFDDPDLLAY